MDETRLIAELRRVESDLNTLERALVIEPDPQKEGTRNQLHDRRAHLLKAIHAGEVHRMETTGLIPWGCDGNCDPCTEHNINGCQRLGNFQRGIRWNAARQCWEKRQWREASPEEVADCEERERQAEAMDDLALAGQWTPDTEPAPERYRAWRTCWTGSAYGDDPLAPNVRWNRHAGRYEAEEWQ